MLEKLKSRKFWLAAIANIIGIVTLVWGSTAGEQVSIIAGAVITILSTLGYLKVEGDIDKIKAANKYQQ